MTTDHDISGPASSIGITWADIENHLLLFTVHGVEKDVHTSLGEKDAVRVDMVDLDTGEAYDDALVFPRKLQGQLRPRTGGMVLGRLGKGTAKAGQNPPWELADPTDAERSLAQEWLAKNPEDPPF